MPSDWGRVGHRPTWSPTDDAPSPDAVPVRSGHRAASFFGGGVGSIFNHIGSIYNRLGINSDHWSVMLRK